MNDLNLSPTNVLSGMVRKRFKIHRICNKCYSTEIYEHPKIIPVDDVNQILQNETIYEFAGGRIIQPVNHIIGRVSIEDSLFSTTTKGNTITMSLSPIKKININWNPGISSGISNGHTIELDYVVKNQKIILRYSVTGNAFSCDNCGETQTQTQPILPVEFWDKMVRKGAPEFYKREIDDILLEIRTTGLWYTDIFRKYEAHPWECDVNENLRDTLHIFYSQVRERHSLIIDEERIKSKKRETAWKAKLPKYIGEWKNKNKISDLDIHFIHLFFFENDFEFTLNGKERRTLFERLKRISNREI